MLVSCTEIEMKELSRQVMTGLATNQGRILTIADIDEGLREALKVGSERVVARVGRRDGFNGDANIRKKYIC